MTDFMNVIMVEVLLWGQHVCCTQVSKPESVLKKKLNEICYHYAREFVAMGESIMSHLPTQDNVADICTKVIPGGTTRD